MRHLLLLLFSFSLLKAAATKLPAEKILLVTVSETGTVTVGRDTVNADNLARYIQERLFKSFLGTGNMHDKIILKKASEEVPDLVTEVIVKEIQAGQKKTLTQISLQKYRKTFESLDRKKQDRLKKLFPVLFQPSFS